METEQSLQYPSSPWPSSSSSSLPSSENPFESFLGCLVTLISKIEIRYEGILYHINPIDSTLGLHTVVCYGTEGRINNNNNGLQIPPINEVFHYITFTGNHIKEMVVSTNCGYYYMFGTTPPTTNSSSKPSRPGGKIQRKKFPLVYTEKLIKIPQEDASTTDSTFDDNRLQIPSSNSNAYDHHWSYHDYYNKLMTNYGVPNNQALITTTHASSSAINPPQSFFTTFPPGPISLRQNPGGFDFGVMNQNFEQYQLWKPKTEDTTKPAFSIDDGSFNAMLEPEEEDAKPDYRIEGSSYTISRMPFDPIGRRPYNPFGPIARPVKNHTKETNIDLQRRYQLQELPQSNFRGGYTNNSMLF